MATTPQERIFRAHQRSQSMVAMQHLSDFYTNLKTWSVRLHTLILLFRLFLTKSIHLDKCAKADDNSWSWKHFPVNPFDWSPKPATAHTCCMRSARRIIAQPYSRLQSPTVPCPLAVWVWEMVISALSAPRLDNRRQWLRTEEKGPAQAWQKRRHFLRERTSIAQRGSAGCKISWIASHLLDTGWWTLT